MDSYLKELQKNWDGFAKADPMYAILTDGNKRGNKWNVDEFFKTGIDEIDFLMKNIQKLKFPNRQITKAQITKALDFGCGIGRLTQPLAKYFHYAYGIDISPSMINLANKYNKYGERVKYIVNESEYLKKFVDNEFDFIVSIITLQHMKSEYIIGYIEEMLRILNNGGILIFQVPDEISVFDGNSYVNRMEYYDEFEINGKTVELVMEMNGIKRKLVENTIENKGGIIIDIQKDDSAGQLASYHYYVTK